MQREGLDHEESERYVAETDRARLDYFRRFFKVQSQDPQHYHLLLNSDLLDVQTAAGLIVSASKGFVGGRS